MAAAGGEDGVASSSPMIALVETKKKKRDNEWILEAREACDSSSCSSSMDENETTIERMRSTALKALSQSHTPTNRDESWRFFDISDLTGAKLVKAEESNGDDEADQEEMKALAADAPEGAKVIAFVNGRFSEKWSSVGVGGEDGVSISRTIGGDVASAIGTYDEDEEVDGQGAVFARINKS